MSYKVNKNKKIKVIAKVNVELYYSMTVNYLVL